MILQFHSVIQTLTADVEEKENMIMQEMATYDSNKHAEALVSLFPHEGESTCAITGHRMKDEESRYKRTAQTSEVAFGWVQLKSIMVDDTLRLRIEGEEQTRAVSQKRTEVNDDHNVWESRPYFRNDYDNWCCFDTG